MKYILMALLLCPLYVSSATFPSPYTMPPERVAALIHNGCSVWGRIAGLVTNYRYSEGEDKTLEDFTAWWTEENPDVVGSRGVLRVAEWVWFTNQISPIMAYHIYAQECVVKSIAQLPAGYLDGLTPVQRAMFDESI